MSTLDLLLVVVGALGVVIVAISARLHQWPVSEPLIAIVAGVLLGPAVTGILELPELTAEPSLLQHGAEVLLAVSVMGVALRYPFAALRRNWRPLALLIGVVMPAMALVSTGLAMWLLGTSFALALLLGAAVCPTDPVLASSAVTGLGAEEDLPERDRQILSLESGANDGLAMPLVLLALAVAGPLSAGQAVLESGSQVLGALVVGVVGGVAAAKALHLAQRHKTTEQGPMLLYTILLALLVLGVCGLANLNGVFGAFCAGLAFNLVSTGAERETEVQIDEAVNQFAVLPFFVALGAMLPWAEWRALGWTGVALAVAVLVLRRLPLILGLARPLGMPLHSAAFLGWFGPVGVAAIFYLTMEVEYGSVHPEILAAGTLIVVASTLAHGISSAPGRAWFRKVERARAD